MGVLWTIFKAVFFPPKLPASDLPGDWPPEGSLRFIECGDVSWKTIPNTYKNYEFSPNEDEYDGRIAKLSIDIMERFCESRQVLTQIYSSWEPLKKEKNPPERFPVQYRRFLEHVGAPISIDAPDEKTLLLLGKGIDISAFWACQDISTMDSCFFDFYVLPENLPISSAKNAKEIVVNGQYDVWFNLSECGPCALYITLNPETVDVAALREIVAAVCREHNILLQNPPKG